MSEFTAVDVAGFGDLAAPQGPLTNSIVHNPFAFHDVSAPAAQSALQGPTTNAIVHNPFAFQA